MGRKVGCTHARRDDNLPAIKTIVIREYVDDSEMLLMSGEGWLKECGIDDKRGRSEGMKLVMWKGERRSCNNRCQIYLWPNERLILKARSSTGQSRAN
jgi:hypothetical protein